MDRLFSKEEINTGRQREFDYLKGFFMLLIYLVHAFQATMSTEDAITRWIYMFATMSGAAIFIFVMGLGTAYSRNATPAGMAKSGVRMVIYQYLNNLAYIAALLLPYPFVCSRLTETGMDNFNFLTEIYIQYINIFFITGIIYLVLALLRKLNLNTAGYAILAVAVSILAPFLYGTVVDVPLLGYIVKLLIGKADFVSFTPLYFLSYALFGVAFGKILRHVKDKKKFYGICAVLCAVIIILWWGLAFRRYGSDISQMYLVFSFAYSEPNLWHVVASMAHVLILAILFFYVEGFFQKAGEQREPKNPIARQLLYYSEHISKYYAMHITVYFVALGIHGYQGFQSYQCWLLALLSIIFTELMVRGYNMLLAKKRSLDKQNDQKRTVHQ